MYYIHHSYAGVKQDSVFCVYDCGRQCSRLTSNPMAPFRWPRLVPSGISSKERASSPSKTAEPALDQSPQGLKVVAEGVNPVVE